MERNGETPEKRKRRKKILAAVLVGIFLLTGGMLAVFIGRWYYMLNQLQRVSVPMETQTQPLQSAAAAMEQTQPPSAVLEETETMLPAVTPQWNIMLIGVNQNLSDTMILCSVDPESQKVTLVSFLRDLYLTVPAYSGHNADKNRLNSCYYWGSKWEGSPRGGMELLGLCIRDNFGIPVDHYIAVDFDAFVRAVDALGGVEVELTEREARYLTKHVGYVGAFEPGLQNLSGTEALAYARIRKIDSDIRRTQRQRTILQALLAKCRTLSLRQLYHMAEEILPLITTDMTNEEITQYLWSMLPLLEHLEIQTITCPVDNADLPGSFWNKRVTIGGTPCDVMECSISKNREYLQRFLDMDS